MTNASAGADADLGGSRNSRPTSPEPAGVELVADLLRRLGGDLSSLHRVAFASTLSRGESASVAETAWQAADLGYAVAREAMIGGATRVDLVVARTAVEFKAMFGAWALAETAASERERWLGADVAKLREATVPAVVVVSVAALGPGVAHQRNGFKAEHGHPLHSGRDALTVLRAGTDAAQAALTSSGCVQVRQVILPVAALRQGEVLLGAVLGAVNSAAAGKALPAREPIECPRA